MIYKAFRDLVATFIKSVSNFIKGYEPGFETILYSAVDREAQKMIEGIISIAPDIINKELKNLSPLLPLKYNKQVLESIYSDISIFKNGYKSYGKGDLDRMKKIILTDTYNKLPASEIQKHLQDSLDVSKKRALLIARAETQNLDSTVKEIYFQEVNNDYDKIWICQLDKETREDHRDQHNKKAGKDGLFNTAWGGIIGPQAIPQQFRYNCRCSIVLQKKG